MPAAASNLGEQGFTFAWFILAQINIYRGSTQFQHSFKAHQTTRKHVGLHMCRVECNRLRTASKLRAIGKGALYTANLVHRPQPALASVRLFALASALLRSPRGYFPGSLLRIPALKPLGSSNQYGYTRASCCAQDTPVLKPNSSYMSVRRYFLSSPVPWTNGGGSYRFCGFWRS